MGHNLSSRGCSAEVASVAEVVNEARRGEEEKVSREFSAKDAAWAWEKMVNSGQ